MPQVLVAVRAALVAAVLALVPLGPASAAPQERARDLPAFTEVSTTWGASCAGADGGRVWCWGSNEHGNVGNGSLEPRFSPYRLAGRWSQVSLAGTHTCGLRGGTAWCWGSGTAGQLGYGGLDDRLTPVRVR